MKEHFGATLMRRTGLSPDPWQLDVLNSQHPRLLLNCARQSGKSTVVAALAMGEAAIREGSQTLLLSRSYRQAAELFRMVNHFHRCTGEYKRKRRNAHELLLESGSRVVCLPCKEDTIRGFTADLVLLDEAARVPFDLYRTVEPMLAATLGRMICLSTPYGKQGFFWEKWAHGGDDYQRIEIPATMCPRIKPGFLEGQRRILGESWFRQEYFCAFEALEGLVFPNFARCVVKGPAPTRGLRVGGIDFGFRNPFAAIWGILDKNNVLWLDNEHYERERPLSQHLGKLPKEVRWHVDPSGANEKGEMRVRGYRVIPGNNDIRSGLSMVTARLEANMIRVVEGTCPNLLAEATLYRYGDAVHGRPETPVDEHNHALSALRYLVSILDQRGLKVIDRPDYLNPEEPPEPVDCAAWNNVDNDAVFGPNLLDSGPDGGFIPGRR